MIPLTLTDDIQRTLLDYLTTTFNFQDDALETALLEFLNQPDGKGMFQGPYVHLRLPFKKAEIRNQKAEDPSSFTPHPSSFLDIAPSFTPYVHQVESFARLTSKDGHQPQPTIITTGTGSGKTECFLFPALDHCYRYRQEPGIKAIILYPMNALATDQAKRLAKTIWEDDRLKGQVTAGLYVGGEAETAHTAMGPDQIIDSRAALRDNPPDILLTNYKMLDFLLLRPEDKPLWGGNGPETLRYLVLDELHTYDGAQGSDVASLIRRLQARLHSPPDEVCPVGTSATVVSESGDTQTALTDFAAQIFATTFPPEAIIGESRQSLAEFLPGESQLFDIPTDLSALAERTGEAHDSYLSRQIKLWFGQPLDPIALGDQLRQHSFLRALLSVTQDRVLPLADICAGLSRWEPTFANLPRADQALVLQSFLSLVAHARTHDGSRIRPFLTLQTQLWVREMSRLMRQVSAAPAFFWRDDVPLHAKPRGLPAYVCRECGHSGWLTLRREGDDAVSDDTQQIYRHYFDKHKNTLYLYPNNQALPGSDEKRRVSDHLCPNCLQLGYTETCNICDETTIPIILHRESSQPRAGRTQRDLQRCPVCATDGSLGILGRQAASLLSVAISHLFTSPLNLDNKLLAFTDSVQDASHRAAFFGARTYRFNLRTAFQAVLEHLAAESAENAEGKPEEIRLSAFTDALWGYWLGRWQVEMAVDGEEAKAGQKLAATFMPPDLQQMAAYRQFMEGPAKPIPSDLERSLRQRLSWEVTMEYGFNSHVGRSLEKVGSSLAIVDPDRLIQAIDKLALVLSEEFGLLKDVDQAAIHHFVIGLLERTRTRGGVGNRLLNRYVREGGNTYMLNKRMEPLLSPFGPNSPRFPRFLNEGSHRDTFDQFQTYGTRTTWFVDWARRTLNPALGVPEINDIYQQVILYLVNADILTVEKQTKSASYSLQPAALLVTRQTAQLRCNVCGQQQTVTPNTQTDWLGQACLNFRCNGVYQKQSGTGWLRPASAESYYRALYEQGQVARIFSYEHTGLLPRPVRERIETGFKEQKRADDPNLLTATPTLEMGIDVGDLSATMACAVPPTTANYLQRIGRAGRATGNALIMTLANAKPHDLYYFEQPLEMIAGAIVPPGCYLDAPNMLKRQFFAFSIDTWTATTAQKGDKLPRNVKEMLSRLKRNGFPMNFLAFYEMQKADLIASFLTLFDPVVSPENQDLLQAYGLSGELPQSVQSALDEALDARDALRKQHRSLRKEEDKIKESPTLYDNPEDQLAEIDREIKVILSSLKSMEETYILNFFTDAGLLPNYAFPESGVKLTAIITGIEAADGEKKYLAKEYRRPAPVAIKELAPFNTFYAENRKVVVSHLDMQGKDTVVERWQFCNRCTKMSPVSASHYSSTCPQCGSEMWHDAGQQHDMVRLHAVSARSDAQRSLANDDGDDRERETYQSAKYFEVDPEQSHGAYLIPGLPFGIEALREVTLREINFGLKDGFGQKVKIADEEQPEVGFQVCPGCGVALDPRQKDRPQHSRNCPAARKSKSDNGSVPWQHLYLYREMTSEALRILLPVSTVLVSEKLATFQACLDLGLRRKFQGDPSHLQIGQSVEVTPDGTRRRYLMIYDTVPGGTSYLRDLVQRDNFREILLLALDTLTSCRCRLDEHKQACYRCLYSYRTQYEKDVISRRLGVEMLQEILAEWPELKAIDSLSGTEMVSLIESELEQRFIDALAQRADKTSEISWQMKIHQGKQAYLLTLGSQKWLVEPQVQISSWQGVAQGSKPDFVFWPQHNPEAKPVAIFTDGFAYHVQPQLEQSRIPDDLRKRQALIDSGKFHVWSLAWDDVVEFAEEEAFPLGFLTFDQRKQLKPLLKKANLLNLETAVSENGVQQLLSYLREPNDAAWAKLGVIVSMTMMKPLRPPVNGVVLDKLASQLQTSVQRPLLTIPSDTPPGTRLYSIIEDNELQLLIHAETQTLKTADANGLSVTLRLDDIQSNRAIDGFKNEWRQFLLLHNLYQFLPGFKPVTSEWVADAEATPVETEPAASEPIVRETAVMTSEAVGTAVDEAAWAEVFEYALPECEALLQQVMAAGYAPPVVGYELVDTNGKVAAMAELVWEDGKTAVFLDDQEEDREVFQQSGWQIFNVSEEDKLIKRLDQATG